MPPFTLHPRPWRAAALVLLALAVPLGALTACQPKPPRSPSPGVQAPVPPVPRSGNGLWIGRAELDRLPRSGAAWARMIDASRAPWGSADLASNDADHDTSVLAGALVSARTGDVSMTAKTRAGIMSVTDVTSFSRVLELSRNITSYVIAADLVGLPAADDARFKAFISRLRTLPLEGHSGGDSLLLTALRSPNNWGTMARAAMSAIDLYLGDRAQLAEVAAAHRAWLGERVANQLRYTDTRWHATTDRTGVNRRGAVVAGRNVDGVLPEDQRRSGEPSAKLAPRGSYPWEALQGATVTGVLLDRAGVVDIGAGDLALARAFSWLYDVNANPAAADDTWQPWVLNRVAGTRFATQAATGSPGKNMAWADWSHGPRL